MSDLTIRDIAKIAGVSTTAVSFVLNNRPGVSDATRQRVQEVIARTERAYAAAESRAQLFDPRRAVLA